MSDTNLPWMLFGRKIRPYSFAVSIASLVIVFGLLIKQDDSGDVLDHTLAGYIIGGTALTSVFLLWGGYIVRSDRWMQYGLLLSTGFFMGRWMFLSLDGSFTKVNAMLSFCWAIASGGAYLIEVVSHRRDTGGRV